MEQHELRPPRGAKRARKRVARGNASGTGTYAGRGLKGQKSRSGGGVRPGFEGGQTPLIRRLPRRRGFRNPFRVAYTPVNVRDLVRFPAGSEVTPESLRESGLVRTLRHPIKVLGDGDIAAALTVRTHRVSPAARSKIEAAGGTVEELTPKQPPKERKRKKVKKGTAQASAKKPEGDEEETAASQEPEAATEDAGSAEEPEAEDKS